MKVVFLGSGNVATRLGTALFDSGNQIIQVWSRSLKNSEELASELGARPLNDLKNVDSSADLYIISVIDDAISTVAKDLSLSGKIVVHTSGTVGMDVLRDVSDKTGVFYPLQTFSKQKPVDFTQIPILIEGSSPEVSAVLFSLAEQISQKVLELDSEGRRILHVAAVFACNFTNHLYTLAQDILDRKNLDFDLLRPLIAETAAKVQDFDPVKVQTGPAVRSDSGTMDNHRELLKNAPELLDLYDKLSRSIITRYKSF